MIATKMRRSILPLLTGLFVAGAVAGVAVWVPMHTRPDPLSGDVQQLITAYLSDEHAARKEYHDTRVTASGIVNWSARSDEVTTRTNDEWSPFLEERSKQATVLLIVDGRHQVLADFDAKDQREALALKAGDRVTIRGRHYSLTSVVYDNKVILVLQGCEVVR